MSETTTHAISAADQRLQHATCKGTGRYVSQAVHFNERFAVATTGQLIAVRLKSSDIHHTNVAFDSANQKTTKRQGDSVAYVRDAIEMKSDDGKNNASVVEGRFPRWEDCVSPEFTSPATKVSRIGLDAALLLKLAKAISEDGENTKVFLEFHDQKSAIRVATSEGKAFGLLMPVTMDSEEYSVAEVIAKIMAKPNAMASEVIEPIDKKHASETAPQPVEQPEPEIDYEMIAKKEAYDASQAAMAKSTPPPVNKKHASHDTPPSPQSVKSAGIDPDTLDWPMIARRYQAGESQKRLASELGVSHGCVFSRLKKMGISRQEKS